MHTRTSVRVIAIGGGGFTHDRDPELDDFVLSQVRSSRPRIGFIATASREDPQKIHRFHRRFSGLCAHHDSLPSSTEAKALAAWLETLDAVYVGGGDTLHLLAHWRANGWDRVLIGAAQRGVLMAGVSAGANVWFEMALSDAGGKGLAPISGIGLVPGSCCPHFSEEPQRQSAFAACVALGELPDGVAIDDGVAVLFEDGEARTAFAARASAGAWHVRRERQEAIRQPIATNL